MYSMKKIVDFKDNIPLPKCMYTLKSLLDFSSGDNFDIGVSNQGSNHKMAEIEQRQDLLLKKLDILYERIKTISTYSSASNNEDSKISTLQNSVPIPEEVVLVVSPDSIPWYLIIIQKESRKINIQWHIHSSVPKEKVPKIQGFVKHLEPNTSDSKTVLRLIFKCVAANSELKLSSLEGPILGTTNILRYLSLFYANLFRYDSSDFQVDRLLDLCHILERASDKNKEPIVKELFTECKNWIYGNNVSIVDLAAYNVVKQWRNIPKSVPKAWYDKCEKLGS